MKKILFLLCLLLGHIASAIAGEYTLDASTLQNSTSVTATFSNGLSITNGGGKTLSQQSGTNYFKFSNGVQYTVTGIPSGETVTSVVFYGFPHDAGNLCYLAEFNGTIYDSSTANFSDGTSTAAKSYTFDGLAITSGSFTFTVGEHQTCLRIVVTTTTDKILKFDKSEYSFDLTDLTANDHMPDPVNTTGATPEYTSSNTKVAACLNGGKPRIKSPGTTTITATAGGKTATYTLTVTSPKATYDLTGNAFEVKSIGTLDKKSFDLDGINVAFGGNDETPVAVAQSDLGVGVMSIDGNGYTFFNNDKDFKNPMGSFIKLTTTKAGTLRVKGNFAADKYTHVYLDNGGDAQAFTEGNDYQEAKLEANKTYFLTTWRPDGQWPTFFLKAISYTTDDATSANKTYGSETIKQNGGSYSWPAKKGQKITIKGNFYKNGDRLFNITNVVDMKTGADVTSDKINGSVSYLVKEDGNVEITNNNNITLSITQVVLENSTPSLSFEKPSPSVGVSASSFSNAVTNAPAATNVTYAITASNNASATIDANTGKLTNLKLADGVENGTITVTATSSALGYYNEGTGSYTLNIVNLHFANANPNITLEASGAASYEQKVQGAPTGVVPVYSYSIVSGTPTVGLEQEQGSEDYNLTIMGTGTIQVTATCGDASASYTLTVSGLTFANVSPSISIDDEDKGFSQQPEDATVKIQSWKIVKKSDSITDASIDNTTGKLTGIKGHGIIDVEVTTSDGKSADYVLTVADRATDSRDLIWNFNTKGQLPSTFDAAQGDDKTGKGNTDITGWTTKYEGLTYSNGTPTSYNHFIYTCDQPIDGDNALYIPATTGLQFTCNSNTFGLNNSQSNGFDRHVSFRGNNNHDNVLTIPQLKKGDYVTIWWRPYSSADENGNNSAGSTFRVSNATDLDGKSIDNAFSTTGITIPVLGQVTFRAKYNGDMNFYIQDNGWNNIYKIRVSRKYSTDLQLSDANNKICASNNNLSILDGQTVTFKGDAGHTQSQAARYPAFTVTPAGNFKDGDVVVTTPGWKSERGVPYYDLQIKVNGGTGNLLVTQDIQCGTDKYVLDRSQTWLAVGQVKQQTYPYTWDFTSYNMDKAATKTVDQLGTTTAGNYGYWDNKALNVITTVTPDPTKLAGYTIDKPLFANGSQLTYGTTTIPETEGLGVSLGNYNADSNDKVGIDGNALAFNSTSAKFTIPNVDAGMYVFVKADKKPTVTNATEATPESVATLPTDVYCYNVATKGNVVLTFPKATKIEKIGVTNIFKTISNKATSESRDRAIDYSQTGVFTSMGMKAYIATQYDNGTGDMGTLTLQQVTAVSKETGLLLYKDLSDGKTIDTQKSFPLFVPAVNVTPSSEKGKLTAHVESGTVQGSDASTLRYVFTNKYYHHGSSQQQTGNDFLFYRVEQSGTLGANKAYLKLSRSSASKQFVVMSFEDAPATGIDAPHMSADPFGDAYYTIQGVRVNGRPSHPGIYIKNGRKVIVK